MLNTIAEHAELTHADTALAVKKVIDFKLNRCFGKCTHNNADETAMWEMLNRGVDNIHPQLWVCTNVDGEYAYCLIIHKLIETLIVLDFAVGTHIAIADENGRMVSSDLRKLAKAFGCDKLHFSIEADNPIIQQAEKYLTKLNRKRLFRKNDNIVEFELEV